MILIYIYIYIYIYIIWISINETSYSYNLLGLTFYMILELVSESDPKIRTEVAKYPNGYWIQKDWISEPKLPVISEPERVISEPNGYPNPMDIRTEWISEDNQT